MGDNITFFHQRFLVNAGVLVGTGILSQIVDIHTSFTALSFRVINANNDATGINRFYNTTTISNNTNAGIACNDSFHTSSNQRLF